MLLPSDAGKSTAAGLTVAVNGRVELKTGGRKSKTTVIDNALQEGRFPNASAIFPSQEKLATYRRIHVDVAMLHDLAAAIGNGRACSIYLPPEDTKNAGQTSAPFVVVGHDDDGRDVGAGLIVPLTFGSEGKAHQRAVLGYARQRHQLR